MRSKLIIRPAILTALILAMPLITTLLNPSAHINGGIGGGADWGPEDFIVMGILLFSAGLFYEFLASKVTTTSTRITIGVVILVGVLAVWAELAVDAISQTIQFLI